MARRRFDHDEADRLHARGLTVAEVARHFDVSKTAVCKALSPEARAFHAEARAALDARTAAFRWSVATGEART